MSNKLYIVRAGCGDFSDRSDWVAAAYESEAMAKEHARRGDAETKRISALEPSVRYTLKNRFGGGDAEGWRVDFDVEETDLLTEVPS